MTTRPLLLQSGDWFYIHGTHCTGIVPQQQNPQLGTALEYIFTRHDLHSALPSILPQNLVWNPVNLCVLAHVLFADPKKHFCSLLRKHILIPVQYGKTAHTPPKTSHLQNPEVVPETRQSGNVHRQKRESAALFLLLVTSHKVLTRQRRLAFRRFVTCFSYSGPLFIFIIPSLA